MPRAVGRTAADRAKSSRLWYCLFRLPRKYAVVLLRRYEFTFYTLARVPFIHLDQSLLQRLRRNVSFGAKLRTPLVAPVPRAPHRAVEQFTRHHPAPGPARPSRRRSIVLKKVLRLPQLKRSVILFCRALEFQR